MTTAPAGWYPDREGVMRYWDGMAWTAHTASPAPPAPIVGGDTSQPPLPPYAASGYAAPSAPPPNPYGYPSGAISPVPQPGVAMVPVQVASAPGLPNGVGIAGFVVGLVSIFLPFVLGLVGGTVGLVLSIVGLARQGRRRGLAIAGLVLSILAIILIF